MEIPLTKLGIDVRAEIKRIRGSKEFKQEMKRRNIKAGRLLTRIAPLNSNPLLFPEKVVIRMDGRTFILDPDTAKRIIVEKEKRITGLEFNPA